MDATFTNSGFILKEETADDVWIFEATFTPANQPNNVARDERTISIEPLVDAPIVSVKSTEIKPHIQAETTTLEINIAALILGGLMIASTCFGIGYLVGTAQHQPCKFEVKQ